MNFIIPMNDLRVLESDGFGPFTISSVDILKDALNAFQSDSSRRDLTIQPVAHNLDFAPNLYCLFSPPILLCSHERISKLASNFLTAANFCDLTVLDVGKFIGFSMAVIEREFASRIDFEHSKFLTIRGMSLERDGGPKIISKVEGVKSWAALEEKRIRRYPFESIVASEIRLAREWCADFFVFDHLPYISENWTLKDSGMLPTANRCEVI